MGSLRTLRNRDYNAHLVYSPSGLMSLFIEDEIRETYGVKTRDAILEVKSEKGFEEMMELMNLAPLIADKWLFVFPEGTSLSIKKKAMRLAEISFGTSVLLIKAKGWLEFKELRESTRTCNDLYLSWIRREDVSQILKRTGLRPDLIEYVAKGYSNNPESIVELAKAIAEGRAVESAKDIRTVIGVGSGTTLEFVLSLLRESSGKQTVRNRIQVMKSLLEEYSPGKLRGYLLGSVKDVYELKVLYLTGEIYKGVYKLPPGYDEKRLSRAGRRLRVVKETPLEEIVRLYLALQESGSWKNDLDALRFIYGFYLAKNVARVG